MANIKKPYDEKIKNAEYLFNQFKSELRRTTQIYNGKGIRATRRNRLNRLRIELNELLLDIERNYPINYWEEVKENEKFRNKRRNL